jgi:hypothetical protein
MNPNSSFSISLSIIVCIVFFLIVLIYVAANIYERHYYVGEGENRQLYKALHITLPGYATVYYPEQKVDLRKWVGTKYNGLVAVNKTNGLENPEATAGLALKTIGLYTDCDLKEMDGHYMLYRSERTKRYFTWTAYYRIWRGKRAD